MPDGLVEVRGDWLKGRKAGFLEAIEDGVVAALRTTSRSFFWKCRPPTWGCGEVEQRVIWI